MSACSSVGRSPDVDEQTIASSAAKRSASASSARFSSMSSGADSCTRSTPKTASSTDAHTTSDPSAGSGASVSRAYARRAFASTSSTGDEPGSYSRTSTPFKRNRAAQPAPITPPPSRPTVAGLDTDAQRELRPHLFRAEHARVHRFENRGRALDEVGVRREPAAREIEVVLEPDADVASDER